MQKQKIILIASLITLPLFSLAQSTPSDNKSSQPKTISTPNNSLNGGTIASQFDYIYNSSNNYQEYKVVKKTSLEKLKNNIVDSLKGMQSKLSNVNSTLSNHDNEVSSLKDSLTQINQELKTTKDQKESFSFLGILLSKSTYNTFVWCLIGILMVALFFYVYRYRQSHTVTAEAKKTLDELKEEFEQHRKKAMEREQKLNRRLQDELNKRF
jgi:beta-lactamase regulating signal transducer with metallopeptidase domain